MVFGALRRTYDRPSLPQAIIMGLGLAILANSRPYEGLIASLPVAGVLLFLLFGHRSISQRRLIVHCLIPISAILVGAALWIGFYNFRVTGHWTVMPYDIHEAQYSVAPYMMWQKVRPEPEYHHEFIRMFHTSWLLPIYLAQQTIRGFLFVKITDLAILWNYYFQIILLLPLIALIRTKWDPWIRFSLAVCTLVTFAIILETVIYPHYAAPITCLLFLIIVYSMRRMRTWSIGPKRIGLMLVRGIVAAYFFFWLIPVGRTIKFSPNFWSMHRARISAQLMQEPGRHLVIVRYMPWHSIHAEWVYNGADIEEAKVLWARDMGPVANQKLLTHFKGHRVWVVLPDLAQQLIPYQQIQQ